MLRAGHAQGGGPGWLSRAAALHLRSYLQIARLWIRAALAYPTSFVLLAVGSVLITALDFVGLWIMFAHLDDLGGLHAPRGRPALRRASARARPSPTLLIGSVERIGSCIRTGRLDQMMTKPVPLLVQVCADQFALRRLGRITQATIVFGWACTVRRLDPGAGAGRRARWW